jgi:drug/metabolite transporter (DMT)-like permease
MTEMAAAFVAMAIGVAGTSVIHLSKGVMRRGIARSSSLIFGVGVLMNFTNPVWVILANRFAPTVFYTSMYGLGLVPLLIYSRLRLDERLSRRQYRGVAIIVVGTLLIGLGNLIGTRGSLYGANGTLLVSIAAGWLIAAPLAAILVRHARVHLQEIVFGVAAGGLAAMEALVKGFAQAGPQGSTFLPQTTLGWWLFGVSFLGAAGAFGMIQWSYLRHCRASMMGSLYDVAYVTIPLVVTMSLVRGASPGIAGVGGIVLLGIGVAVTTRGSDTALSAVGVPHSQM